jgi:hypothetical protein
MLDAVVMLPHWSKRSPGCTSSGEPSLLVLYFVIRALARAAHMWLRSLFHRPRLALGPADPYRRAA